MNRLYDLDAIESRIKSPEELSPYIVLGLYGRPGSGKTTLCASGATLSPRTSKPYIPNTLIIDTERGSRSLRGAPGVKVFPVTRWPDIEQVYHLLISRPHLAGFERGVIAVDTLSSLLDLALRHVAGDTRIDMTRLITEESGKVSQPEYGDAGRKMAEMINKFSLLGDRCNVIFTLHQRRLKETDTEAEVVPDLTPMARQAFLKAVDLLGYLTAEMESDVMAEPGKTEIEIKPKFTNWLSLQPSLRYESKDRVSGLWVPPEGRLPPMIKNPTLPAMLARYRKGIIRSSDRTTATTEMGATA